MSDSKISALTDGTAPQDTDDFVVARAGGNNRLSWSVLKTALSSLFYSVGGTDVAVADGGTGGSDAATARANLSAAPSSAKYIVQTADSELSAEQSLAALATGIVKNTTTTGVLSIAAAGTDYYAPGGTDVAVADGGTGASDASTARTNLGLVIGTDVQAHDADLDALAGLVSAADKLPYFTGSGTAAVANFTAAGRALVDDADAAAQRTTLGLGTIATQASNNVSITGGAISGITDLALADGGTGASLTDPNADRIMFWDDSAGSVDWLTAGTGLSISGTTISASGGISSGTSFPVSPSTNDLFYRTDLGLLCFYDGTRWLTTTLYEMFMGAGAALTTSGDLGQHPTLPSLDMWIVTLSATAYVSAPLSGSAYWTFTLYKKNAADSSTSIGSVNTSAGTAAQNALYTSSIGAAVGGPSTYPNLYVGYAKSGSPGAAYPAVSIQYRLIAT